MSEEIKYMNKTLAKPGFTLVELILVVAMIAVVGFAIAGLVRSSYEDWKLGSDRSSLLQDGRAAIEQMVRILRQAQRFSSVSPSTDEAGCITFTDVNGIAKQFKLNTDTSELEYGQPGALSALAGPVSKLVFTCYDIDANSLAGAVQANSIKSVHIEATFVDAEDSSMNFTLSGRVFCPKDFLYVVVNELMYNPPGSGDAAKEWVELYNSSDSAVDANGWTIQASSQTDPLSSHLQFGDGTTTIDANGYAVVTTKNTTVYNERVTNGSFNNKNQMNRWPRSNWSRTKWNGHIGYGDETGKWKLESTVAGNSWVYQQISLPAGYNSYLFLFWEKTTTPVSQTQITATIRNLSDQVLATGYSDQMHSDWTCHIMDLIAYAGQNIRIHFSTNKSTGEGVLMLDDVSVASSYVDINAVRLSVDDNRIGNRLGNNTDTVAVTDGSAIIDSVTYDDSWGGDGNGTSLARIDPQGGSNDPDNWQSGPVNGTPGSAN